MADWPDCAAELTFRMVRNTRSPSPVIEVPHARADFFDQILSITAPQLASRMRY